MVKPKPIRRPAARKPVDPLDDAIFWRRFATNLIDIPMLHDQAVAAAAIKAGVNPQKAIGMIWAYCHQSKWPIIWQ